MSCRLAASLLAAALLGLAGPLAAQDSLLTELAHAGGTARPHGWHVQCRPPWAKVQLLARWDALRADGLGGDGDVLVFGVRATPTGAIQFQFNHSIDVDHAELSHHRAQAGIQLGF